MNIIEINGGRKIEYGISGKKISFGDDELTINLEKFQREEENHIDICRDKYGNLVMGVVPGLAETYAAQVDIPAREYQISLEGENEDGNPVETVTPLALDMAKCTLTLWGDIA